MIPGRGCPVSLIHDALSDEMKARMRRARTTRRWPVLLAAAGASLLLAGCSGGTVATKTMTQAQATVRAGQILTGTATALTPRPQLDFDPALGNGADQCLADIPDADKMVNVNRIAWLRAIAVSRNGSIGRQVEAYWKKQGYSISTASGFDQESPVITGETSDHFTISLATGKNGLMSISASSPCIYPEGTPPS